MLYLITGGSGSGKSEYAENLAAEKHRMNFRSGYQYYAATMQPYDDECLKRIDRHRKMRKEKGFSTMECYTNIAQIAVEQDDVLLLECMSNLLANEMFLPQGQIKKREEANVCMESLMEQAILAPILELEEKAGCVIVVTNEVFSDGMNYEGETKDYVRLLGKINESLAAAASAAVEVVCSIPVYLKGACP